MLGYSPYWTKGHITPLEYAIKNRQDEAILLLLDTNFVTKRRYNHVLEMVIQYHYQPSSRIVTATIEAMVQRSNRLRSLAIAHLSPQELDRLCISYKDEPIQILDAYAVDTAEALRNVGVKIPEALEPVSVVSTVYHSLGYVCYGHRRGGKLWAEFADRLWSSGFHDTNTYDAKCFTPLHLACVYFELDVVNWLMSHGGDPTTVVRGHSLNAFHLLSCRVKEWLKTIDDLTTKLVDIATRMGRLCGTSCRDSCRCACSPQGCTPTTILLRAVTLTWDEKKSLFLSWCRCVDLSPDAVETCCFEFARVETFERLGITHVCCVVDLYDGVSDPMPQDTIEEIQDEESEMIDQLESYMTLYEEEKARFEGFPIQFLSNWSDMLKDELGVPEQFEEYWREIRLWDEVTSKPDYFAKPSHVEHGHKEMDEDQDCISDYHTKPSRIEQEHEEMDKDQVYMSNSEVS